MLCYHLLSDLECGHQLSPCYLCSALLSQTSKTNKYFYHRPQTNFQTWWRLCRPVDIFILLYPWRVIILNTMAPFNLVTFLPSLLCDAATEAALLQLSSCKNTQIFIWKENVDTTTTTVVPATKLKYPIYFKL